VADLPIALPAAFATSPGLELKYSGHQVEMHAPFPSILEDIATRLSSDDCLGESVKFNHAMLNHYQDGQVYIGRHSDNSECSGGRAFQCSGSVRAVSFTLCIMP
jgi:hypothetical protein